MSFGTSNLVTTANPIPRANVEVHNHRKFLQVHVGICGALKLTVMYLYMGQEFCRGGMGVAVVVGLDGWGWSLKG